MTDKKPDEEAEVTPKGAVEIDEKDLDAASGGTEFVYLKLRGYDLSPPPDLDLAGKTVETPDVSPEK